MPAEFVLKVSDFLTIPGLMVHSFTVTRSALLGKPAVAPGGLCCSGTASETYYGLNVSRVF